MTFCFSWKRHRRVPWDNVIFGAVISVFFGVVAFFNGSQIWPRHLWAILLETKVAWCLNLEMSQLHVICLSTVWFWILWIHFGSFVFDHCVVFNAAVSTFGHHHMFWAQCVKFDLCTHFAFCQLACLVDYHVYSVQMWHLVVWAFWNASTFQLCKALDWCSVCCVILYGQCDAR